MSYYGYRRRTPVEKSAHLKSDALKARIEALRDNPHVDDWTRNFSTSILEGFNKYGGLTQRQFDIFVKNEQKFSAAALASSATWKASYGDPERKIAKICASFYKANPPYFSDLADRVLTDPDFVPTEKAYKAMCGNKYAAKVLAGVHGPPLFKDGAVVELRVPARSPGLKTFFVAGWRGIVIQSDASPVTSAAKGAKKYKVLPFGGTKMVTVEERQLKIVKGV